MFFALFFLKIYLNMGQKLGSNREVFKSDENFLF
jgi:hypothetical protein